MNKKLAVLVSGTGSLLQAILEQGVRVALVLADRPCPGIDEVPLGHQNIKTKLVKRKSFNKDFNRAEYTGEVLDVLHQNNIDVVAMAGFMTLFSPEMFLPHEKGGYGGLILNTHPSLLPAFKGAHAVQDALDYGVKISGCTIHIATADLDAGPILAQESVPILENDTKEKLHERIKEIERVLYPQTIKKFISECSN